MLHILLLILKIIGMILAALVGLLLLALACILVVPVRYCIEADGKLGRESPVHVGAKASWLLHMINVTFAYPGTSYVKVRIFCFTIFDSSARKKRRKVKAGKEIPAKDDGTRKNGTVGKEAVKAHTEEKKEEKKDEIAAQAEGGKEESPQIMKEQPEKAASGSAERNLPGTSTAEKGGNCVSEDKKETEIKETTIKETTIKDTIAEGPTAKEDSSADEETDIEKEKDVKDDANPKDIDAEEEKGKGINNIGKGIWRKIKAFFLALKRFFYKIAESLKNIEYTVKKICDKLKRILRNIQYYLEILQSETFRKVWEVSKKQLFRIFKMLCPQVCRIHLLAGTGNPAGAGQILAIYGILYPFIGRSVSVEADFENKVIEGSLFIKGRIRMLAFMVAAIHLLVNKNVWRLLKMLKNPSAQKNAEDGHGI